MKVLEMPITIGFEEDVYIARCPGIQGAFAEGETPEEALQNLIDVIKMVLTYKKERNELKDIEDLMIETSKVVTTVPIEV